MKNVNEKIDFNAIGAMLCGDELTEAQKKEVEKFKEEYDETKEKRNTLDKPF